MAVHPFRSLSLPLLLLAAGACGRAQDSARSALLITLDTTNPEALGCYGGPAGVTPHLDALAAEGIVFEDARTVAPMTLPSHASMLTGLYPLRHTVRVNASMALPEEAETLAERAREAGLQTAAFVASVVLNRDFGLAQGFERYGSLEDLPALEARVPSSRDARAVADEAIAWLRDERDPRRPFFLWVHFFDPHFPYEPPATFRAQAGGEAYLGEVAYADAHVGRLLAELERAGLSEETFVAVVSDHGEGLERHGETAHSAFAFDSTLAVPLILRRPDRVDAGRRVPERVSVVDLFPTLLEAMGLGTPGDVDGHSLLAPTLDPERGVYFETYFGFVSYGWSHLAGWVDGHGKYLHSSAPELYELSSDPGETVDRIAQAGERARPYRAALAQLSARPILAPADGPTDADAAAQIEKLGYAGVGSGVSRVPAPLDPSDRPAPHTRIQAHRDFLNALALSDAGRQREAIELFQGVVADTPTNHSAWYELGMDLRAAGDVQGALRAFATAAELRDGQWIPPLLNLAGCYEELGKVDRAIEAYRRAFAGGVGPPEALQRLIKLLRLRGRTEEVREYRALLAELTEG